MIDRRAVILLRLSASFRFVILLLSQGDIGDILWVFFLTALLLG